MRAVPALRSSGSLSDQAYEVILDAICEGRLPPGARINQDELAAQLNVSRQPVTQALFLLKVQGFVCETGRRGVLVAPMNRDILCSIFQMRLALEPLAVAMASVDRAALQQGRKLISHGRSLADDDGPALIRADMDFHLFLYELSGNILVGQTMRQNWRHLQRAMGEVLRIPGQSMKVWNEHETIFEWIACGKVQDAAAAMRRHMFAAAARVAPFALDDLKRALASQTAGSDDMADL